MPTCKVCAHPERAAIDALLTKEVSLKAVAQRFGFSKSTVGRHSLRCMKRTPGGPEIAPDNESLTRWKRMYARVERLLKKAERKGNDRVAAELIGRLDDLQERIELASAPGTARPEDTVIRVVYDEQPGFGPMSHNSIRFYASELMLAEAQEPDLATDETLLACVAFVVTRFRNEKLPPELEKEVHAKVRLVMEGNLKGNPDEATELG
jgi:hypothetical protein